MGKNITRPFIIKFIYIIFVYCEIYVGDVLLLLNDFRKKS